MIIMLSPSEFGCSLTAPERFCYLRSEAVLSSADHLAEALAAVAKEGVDPSSVNLDQIPVKIRPQVVKLLAGLNERAADDSHNEIVRSSELVRSLKLKEQYFRALETQKTFNLLNHEIEVPDFDQVLQAFTPEMLDAAQRRFQNPTLILNPKGVSFNDLVAAMNKHKIVAGQGDVDLSGFDDMLSDYKLEHWSTHIIDGAPEMRLISGAGDNLLLNVGDRWRQFLAYKQKNGLNGMNRWLYAQFIMQQMLENGRPVVDKKSMTALDEDLSLKDSKVLGAYWNGEDRTARFVQVDSDIENGNLKFRRSVGGAIEV